MSQMAMGLTLVCDNRERGLIRELVRRSIPHTVAALDVGDFMIQTAEGTPLLVAERKSHADFAASNSDGRYREQRARLMAVRGSGVAVLYIIEGAWSADGSLTYCGGRTTEELLQRLTTRLILRYGMPVLASASLAETARWCQVLLGQLTADPSVFQPEDGLAAATTAAMTSFTAAISTVKKSNKTAAGTANAMLSAIPGLGDKRVTSLLGIKSIADLALMSETDIAGLIVGGKRIGDKLATVIHEALRVNLK